MWWHSCRCPENPKPQHSKETKAAATEAVQAGQSKCQLTIFTITQFIHPKRINEYKISAITNEQKIGAGVD